MFLFKIKNSDKKFILNHKIQMKNHFQIDSLIANHFRRFNLANFEFLKNRTSVNAKFHQKRINSNCSNNNCRKSKFFSIFIEKNKTNQKFKNRI